MTENSNPQGQISQLWQWLKKPPQIYVFYLVCLILVGLVSFFAGTLNQRRGMGFRPPATSSAPAPPVSAPKN